MEFSRNRIAAAALLLSSLTLTACTDPYSGLPDPTPVETTSVLNPGESHPGAEKYGLCPTNPDVDLAQGCVDAITKQLVSQGFEVDEVFSGTAKAYWATVNLKQCERPYQNVGFDGLSNPIVINVVGDFADGNTFTKPSQIPNSRCTPPKAQ